MSLSLFAGELISIIIVEYRPLWLNPSIYKRGLVPSCDMKSVWNDTANRH